MLRKMDVLANAAIFVLCLTVTGLLIQRTFLSSEPSVQVAEKGSSLGPQEGFPSDATGLVLMVALAPTCRFCDESMGFYRGLSERRDAGAVDVRLVAAVGRADHAAEEGRKLQAAGVGVDQVVVTDFKALGVPGTPMLIAADRHGKVLGTWLGKLGEAEQKEVMETLGLGDRRIEEALAPADWAPTTVEALSSTPSSNI